jgi:hypothetical protein
LTILDALMQNAGTRFQKNFSDEMLLERLRILPTDDMVDISVRNRCNQLYRGWAITYKDTPGMQSIANLHKQLPKKQRQQVDQNRYKVIRDTEREAQDNPFGKEEELESRAPATPPPGSRRSSVNAGTSSPGQSSYSPHSAASSHARTTSTSKSTADPEYASGGIWGHHSRKSSKSKTSKHGQASSASAQQGQVFDLAKEKNSMLSAIANSSIASTNLLNAMRHLDRQKTRVSEDADCLKRFETCKALRRQILRYIQLVESEQWIGSLLNANDDLVKALIAFEINDKSVDEDSDSEGETEMYNDPTKGGLVLRGREEEGVAHPAGGPGASRAPSTEGTGTQSRRTSVHRAPPPVPTSAPPSRRASLAAGGGHGQSNLANDFNNMNFGSEGAPPPKPPRPMHLPPVVQHLNESRGHHQAGRHDEIPPTPITEANEDDPFGDQNAF